MVVEVDVVGIGELDWGDLGVPGTRLKLPPRDLLVHTYGLTDRLAGMCKVDKRSGWAFQRPLAT